MLRSVAVYLFLVLALRLGGKRELAQLNSFDLVVLLLLSNTVQNATIASDNSLLGGLFGAAVLLGANYAIVWLGFRHPALARTLEGTSTVLVDKGRTLDGNLRRYLITREELMATVRRQGARNLEDIEVVVLEANGALTVEQHDRTEALLQRLQRIEATLVHGQGSGSERWPSRPGQHRRLRKRSLMRTATGRAKAAKVTGAGDEQPLDVVTASRTLVRQPP